MTIDDCAGNCWRRTPAIAACLLVLFGAGCQPRAPSPPAETRKADRAGPVAEESAPGGTAGRPDEDTVGEVVSPMDASVPASGPSEERAERFLPLVGRWVRTDSPYVIEIRGVGREGNMEAAYFNPRPINVSRALARSESGELRVFVELRDVNYPGATYTLAYDRSQDLLQGVYFQPALGQGFGVIFARVQADTSGP